MSTNDVPQASSSYTPLVIVPGDSTASTQAGPNGTGSNPEIRPSGQLSDGIALAKQYLMRAIEDVIKPAIASFLETCDTNPRAAAIMATPLLLGFLLFAAFCTLSTIALVLWTIITIFFGVLFVIIGGLISLVFKLLLMLVAIIPLAGIATVFLIAANAAFQYIASKVPQLGAGTRAALNTLQEIDWNKIAAGTISFGKVVVQSVQKSSPVLLKCREGLVTASLAVYSTMQKAAEALHKNNAATDRTDQQRDEQVVDPSVMETTAEPVHTTAVIGKEEEYSVQMEPRPEASVEGLKHRAPFSGAGGLEEEETDTMS